MARRSPGWWVRSERAGELTDGRLESYRKLHREAAVPAEQKLIDQQVSLEIASFGLIPRHIFQQFELKGDAFRAQAAHRFQDIARSLHALVSGRVQDQRRLEPVALGRRNLPFAWIEECPRLVEKEAGDLLILTADAAAKELRERYDLPLALIIVDTVAAGAGFDDENSAVETTRKQNGRRHIIQIVCIP